MALDNNTILDQIMLHGSNDYQQRVPDASQATLAEVGKAIDDHRLWGEFEKGLINRIATAFFTVKTWNNPLGFLKKGMIEYGTTIQEIALGMIKADVYDPFGRDLLRQKPADVYSAFHEINRKDKYLLTVSREELKAGFLSPNGLSEIVSRKIDRLIMSDNYDEYLAILEQVYIAMAKNEVFNVNVSFADEANPTEAELKALSTAARTYGKKMTIAPTALYNAAGVPTVNDKDELMFITKPEIIANLDVNVLADAFNIDRADFVNRVVEVNELPAGVHALLVSVEWFVIADRLIEIRDFENGSNLTTNYWLHHWQVISRSPYAQAVAFSNQVSSTVPVVNVELTDLELGFLNLELESTSSFEYGKGENEDGDYPHVAYLDVVSTGTVSPSNDEVQVPSAYTVEEVLVADSLGAPVKKTSRTYVDRLGKVYVQEGLESGSTITVNIRSAYVNPSVDPEVSDITASAILTVA